MIYVPETDTYNLCYVVTGEGVVRGYDTYPQTNRSYNYRDYYVNSNYIFRDGSGTWSQYTTLPICLDFDIITNDYYYRNDFASICLIFIIFAFIIIYLPFKLFSRLFGRWLKL